MAPLNEHKTRKKGIFGIFGHSLFLFFQKKQMRYPSSLSSSIQKSPWNLFIVIHIPSWNGFQLFPKAVGKSFVSSNKKICNFRTITSKVSTNMWVSDSVLSKSKKMCINSNNEMSWKKWALYYRLHCTLLRILKVSLTLLAVWGNDLSKSFPLKQWEKVLSAVTKNLRF